MTDDFQTRADIANLRGDLLELRRYVFWQNMLIISIIVWLAAVTFADDQNDALRDRSQLPATAQPHVYYLGFESVKPSQREQMLAVLNFTICSCNSKVVIEQQLPARVSSTLVRIDARDLGWSTALPKVAASYPYRPGVLRADWFIQFVLDDSKSNGLYHELLFGEPVKKVQDFQRLVGAIPASPYRFAWVEDESRVNLAGTRLITTTPGSRRNQLWTTYDSEIIDDKKDPLENLLGSFDFDASELIATIPKSVAITGQTGHLQVYGIFASTGEPQRRAPASIVTDSTGTRGSEIRNSLSCVVCHSEGLREPTTNGLRRYIESGAELYTTQKQQRSIEQYHLTDIRKLIRRSNEDYAEIVLAITGMDTTELSLSLKNVVKTYDKPLSLSTAARELSITADEFRIGLARFGVLPARLAQLPHGQTITRTAWETHYKLASDVAAGMSSNGGSDPSGGSRNLDLPTNQGRPN